MLDLMLLLLRKRAKLSLLGLEWPILLDILSGKTERNYVSDRKERMINKMDEPSIQQR